MLFFLLVVFKRIKSLNNVHVLCQNSEITSDKIAFSTTLTDCEEKDTVVNH